MTPVREVPVAVVRAQDLAQSQRTRPPSKDGAEASRGPRDLGRRDTSRAWTASKVAWSMMTGISYSTISDCALRSPSPFRSNSLKFRTPV
ncbi:hypothetical protein RN69_07080 [Bradyrhizobium japonicum]|nr:hypothetical protein RN69_07080 [Bradyrhizobium japonicum]KMK00403.1 hypothetical protein CF64_07145 [Bradyrhizobium japonicum]